MPRLSNCAFAALVWAALPACSTAALADATIEVSADGDLLNIKVSEAADVDAVMQEIGKVLGAKVEGGGCGKKVGPLDLSRVTFKQALENVAAECSFIIERQGETAKIRRILLIETGPPQPGQAMPNQAPQNAQEAGSAQQRAAAQAAAPSGGVGGNGEAQALQEIARLGSVGDQAAQAQLEKLAETHASIVVRTAALRTMASFAAEGAGPYLETKLLNARSSQTRLAAAEALTDLDPDLAKTAIAKAVGKESDPAIRDQLKALSEE